MFGLIYLRFSIFVHTEPSVASAGGGGGQIFNGTRNQFSLVEATVIMVILVTCFMYRCYF
jgi:hypothetical protein